MGYPEITTKTSDECWEERRAHSYKIGISVGLERAAKRLMTAATDAFQAGNDPKAKDLRSLAMQFEEDAKRERPEAPPK